MESFPDEVLVHVFGYVHSRMLLRELRAVCRRWRDLALHPDAWSARHILCFRSQSLHFYSRLFALVPCVDELCFFLRDAEQEAAMAQLAARTLLAARRLKMILSRPEHVDMMLEVLRNQVDLKRIRSLSIAVPNPGKAIGRMLELVKDLNLDELIFDDEMKSSSSEAVPVVVGGRWGKGSLRKFAVWGSRGDPVVEFVVKHRSHTLQAIEFVGVQENEFSVPVLARLTECSKLTYARAPASWEVASLLMCPTLTSLRLSDCFSAGTEDTVKELGDAIASAIRGSQLRALELCSSFHPSDMIANVLSTLSSFGSSCRVEELRLVFIREAPDLEFLKSVLRGMRHLRVLELNRLPSVELLTGIVASEVPRMTMLKMSMPLGQCVSMCTMRAVRGVVRRNPQLHAVIQCRGMSCHCKAPFGVYGHDPGEACQLHCSSIDWQWADKYSH